MKTTQILFVFLLLFGTTSAQEFAFPQDSIIQEKSAPRFENYRASDIYKGKNASVRLTSSQARMYRTMLRENAKKSVNFAGHYIIATWGCGSGCHSIAIIDARTGRVYFSPIISFVGMPRYQEINPSEFRKNSRLLKIVGAKNDNDKEIGTFYYEWKNNRLRLVRAYRNKQVK